MYSCFNIACRWVLLPLLLLLLLQSIILNAEGRSTLESLPSIAQYAQQLSTDDLSTSLELYISILEQHNARLESTALAHYIMQLQAILQPGCCDYFTALPIAKGLAPAVSDVVALRMPSEMRPVVRRSFVCAVWLLQRSKYFKWDSSTMQKAAVSGFYKLYEDHIDAAAGRPVSFHHISKTGGTSLCGVAWENGCRGPGMSKRDNCLLDPGLDGPLWVLRHDVAAANNITAGLTQPNTSRTAGTAAAAGSAGSAPGVAGESDKQRLAQLMQRMQEQWHFDWFMYDCPAQQLSKVGRQCRELQEAAVSKAATFFAAENMLPQAHGSTQVCEAFTNVVIVREAVSEAISLMAEVSLVYARLLKQRHILGWWPPKWSLHWWRQWAPVVVNSYAARTLLGPAAFCPATDTAAAGSDAGSSSGTQIRAAGALSRDNSGSGGHYATGSAGTSAAASAGLAALTREQLHEALRTLASFDVVMDLGSLPLVEVSLAKLLGWTSAPYGSAQRKRPAPQLDVLSWQQLELLARQEVPGQAGMAVLQQAEGAQGMVVDTTTGSEGNSKAGGGSGGNGSGAGASSVAVVKRVSDAATLQVAVSSPSGRNSTVPAGQQQQRRKLSWFGSASTGDSMSPSSSSSSSSSSRRRGSSSDVLTTNTADEATQDLVRRLLAEMYVRQLYAGKGVPAVLLPVILGMQMPQPPAGAVDEAMAALRAINASRLVIEHAPHADGTGEHMVVHIITSTSAGVVLPTNTAGGGAPALQGGAAMAAAAGASASGGSGSSSSSEQVYHVWLRHGVLLAEVEYQQLLQATSADRELHRHGRVMQLLDAAWVGSLMQQRRVRRMLHEVEEEVQAACGFAGLNHLQ